MTKKYSNAYRMRMELAENVANLINQSFKKAFEEAIEAACSYLYAKTKMSGTEISKFRQTMEEILCKETSK